MSLLTDFLAQLPPVLLQRVRHLNLSASVFGDGFVLYWMRNALRMDDNPALEVTIRLANHLKRPLLIYHELSSETFDYASDRHYTFVLEGIRELQSNCLRMGFPNVCHVQRSGSSGSHLLKIAQQAGALITEEMPVAPLKDVTHQVASQLDIVALAVDTACVVPMQKVGHFYERAFEYRQATKLLYAQNLSTDRPREKLDCHDRPSVDLEFEPIDLLNTELDQLISECPIDHSIGPVFDTPGGERAGYQRWQDFKQNQLSRYAQKRNDPLAHSVSRLSAYLHYGMVSPMRIAAEAKSAANEGAEKYLDELLIWRELAYCFCFFREDHATWSALPTWARETLLRHRDDARLRLFSWETLARGETGDRLWDAAQKSLLRHGELHNNVRMTWGKAILNWTRDPQEALGRIIDLNHRFALDGRDPASYGGILWCLGQFDRPFSPERPILGTVRERSTTEHAQRLNVDRYYKHCTRPPTSRPLTVAVVGAGIAGLCCARILSDHGFDVTVFEKSRGPGGRMATRHLGDSVSMDHGAQYFTVRDPLFRRHVDAWVSDGLAEAWKGRIVSFREGRLHEEKSATERYVAIPGMNAIAKHLAEPLKVRTQTLVQQIQLIDGQWALTVEPSSQVRPFDYLVLAIPAAQAVPLLQLSPRLLATVKKVKMNPCWCVLLESEKRTEPTFDGAFVNDSPLSWLARNSSKPGRHTKRETWVLHASSEWTQSHIDANPTLVQTELIRCFAELSGIPENTLHPTAVHLWRYALAANPLAAGCLWDPSIGLGTCGDWCASNRIEGAFLSGSAMAGRLMGAIHAQTPQPNS